MHDEHEIGTIPPDEADPHGASTSLVEVISVILTLVTIVLLQVVYYKSVDAEHERKIINAESRELLQLRSEQSEQLTGGRWVDQSSGMASIPIEQAMGQVVQEVQARRAAAE